MSSCVYMMHIVCGAFCAGEKLFLQFSRMNQTRRGRSFQVLLILFIEVPKKFSLSQRRTKYNAQDNEWGELDPRGKLPSNPRVGKITSQEFE